MLSAMAPAALPDDLRTHLAVSFDLLAPLGEGGMGIVWLGRDRLLDREVAIKVLKADTAGDTESARRFLQEARLAARLQHPGVVPLLIFGEVAGLRYYVMPYVRGETLAARLGRGPLPEREARRIIAEVADALAYVHAQGIVHRDVKPANILIEEGTGRAVLADFGIARGSDGGTSLTATGMVVGTPMYLAPEQAMGGAESVDGRADVYALGVVAWEALVGASPFAGATPQEVMARKMTGGIPNVSERVPGAAATVADAIMRATAPDPAARWATAAEFAGALREADEVDPIPADLRPLRGVGGLFFAGLLPAAAAGYFVFARVSDGAPLVARALLPPLIGAFIVSLLGVARLAVLRSEHAPTRRWREVWPVFMRPPIWWSGWWPKQWRGPDILDRLPSWVSRGFRQFNSALVAMVPLALALCVPIVIMQVATPDELVHMMGMPFYAITMFVARWTWVPTLAILGAGVWRITRLNRQMEARGVSRREVQRFMGSLHDPAVWQVPWVRALMDEAGPASTNAPRELAALLDGVAALASALRGAGWPIDDFAPFLSDARDADTQWAREQEELAADADPAEAGRLRERLEKLRAASARGAAQDEMIALQERQLALHEQAETRRLAIEAQRARLRDGCALVYRQLRALRADDALRAGAAEVTGQVRALTTDLARLRAAAEEAGR